MIILCRRMVWIARMGGEIGGCLFAGRLQMVAMGISCISGPAEGNYIWNWMWWGDGILIGAVVDLVSAGAST